MAAIYKILKILIKFIQLITEYLNEINFIQQEETEHLPFSLFNKTLRLFRIIRNKNILYRYSALSKH